MQPRRQRMSGQKTVAWLEEQLKARSTKIELGYICKWSDDQLEQGGLLLAEYGDCVEELVGAALHFQSRTVLHNALVICVCAFYVHACVLLVVAVLGS